jgi:hypothetical protein
MSDRKPNQQSKPDALIAAGCVDEAIAMVADVIRKGEGNLRAAAQLLGVHEATIHRLIRKIDKLRPRGAIRPEGATPRAKRKPAPLREANTFVRAETPFELVPGAEHDLLT